MKGEGLPRLAPASVDELCGVHGLGIETVYKGNVNTSVIRTARLFREIGRRK